MPDDGIKINSKTSLWSENRFLEFLTVVSKYHQKYLECLSINDRPLWEKKAFVRFNEVDDIFQRPRNKLVHFSNCGCWDHSENIDKTIWSEIDSTPLFNWRARAPIFHAYTILNIDELSKKQSNQIYSYFSRVNISVDLITSQSYYPAHPITTIATAVRSSSYFAQSPHIASLSPILSQLKRLQPQNPYYHQ